MRRLCLALAFCLASFGASAQTGSPKSLSALTTEINSLFASGQQGGITALQLRQVTLDMINSSGNILSPTTFSGAVTFTGGATFSTLPTTFNSTSTFAGAAIFNSTASFTGPASMTLGTITTNTLALSITGTFNNNATVFDAPFLMNITNTASAAGSKIADFQLGGTSRVSVGNSGGLLVSGSDQPNDVIDTAAHLIIGTSASFRDPSSGRLDVNNALETVGALRFDFVDYTVGPAVELLGATVLSWNSTGAFSGGDVALARVGAGALEVSTNISTPNALGTLNLATLNTALGTVTTNVRAVNITGTWNAGGTTFDAPLFVNITNTASAAGSLIADLQIGGQSWMALGKAGGLLLHGAAENAGYSLSHIILGSGGVISETTSPSGIQFNGIGGNNIALVDATNNLFEFYDIIGHRAGVWLSAAFSNVGGFLFDASNGIGWSSSANDAGNPAPDTSISRSAAGVVQIGTGSIGAGGWAQWAGEARVTSDFSKTSDTGLANVTGLSVSLSAGRKYSFHIPLFMTTGATAGGIKVALGGTATVTNLIADGVCQDGPSVILINVTQVSALGSNIVANTNAGTTPLCLIDGTFEVNAAGTLTVQFAQNASSGTASTVKRGSYMWVQDMP